MLIKIELFELPAQKKKKSAESGQWISRKIFTANCLDCRFLRKQFRCASNSREIVRFSNTDAPVFLVGSTRFSRHYPISSSPLSVEDTHAHTSDVAAKRITHSGGVKAGARTHTHTHIQFTKCQTSCLSRSERRRRRSGH